MPSKSPSLRTRWIRFVDPIFDAIGLRPVGIAVFAASALLLIQVIGLSANAIRADGVAVAALVDHPSRVASFVTRVFVKPGEQVEIGAPLVELSSHFLDQEIARIDLEIEQLVNESKLAQAKLVVDEERWVNPALRLRPGRPSLATPTAAYYAKQLEVMRTRRASRIEDRRALIVAARFEGVVAQVAWLGASVAEGASVASLMPEFAEEIVAYVPPRIDPTRIANGGAAYMVGAETRGCRAPGRVRSRGAAVEEAPPQLQRFLRESVHGMPVHVTLPPDCRLANGQVLALDFRRPTGD